MSDGAEYSVQARRVHGGGLRVTVSGPRSLANTVGYWEQILAQVQAERPPWLLVCDDLRGEELTGEQWCALVNAMVGRGLEGVRIAHVKPTGLAKIEYCELCARGSGPGRTRVHRSRRRRALAALWRRGSAAAGALPRHRRRDAAGQALSARASWRASA